MASATTIAEIPAPPKGRPSFPGLIARMLRNPISAWGEDFYRQKLVYYRWLGLETLFVLDPEIIQTVLLDEIDSFSKQPLYDDVFGEAIGGSMLNAEGISWRWQRRLAAPIFRPEDMLDFVPAFSAASVQAIDAWRACGAAKSQRIDRDMGRATLQVLQDTVLGANLSAEDRAEIEQAAGDFLRYTVWKIAMTSLRLPPKIPHPGARSMSRAARKLREMAATVLARTRDSATPGEALLGRLVTARDPATGEAMPDPLIVDNVVTFLVAGHETTAQALTWMLYLLACFPAWQDRLRQEVRQAAGEAPIGREALATLTLLDAAFHEAMRLFPPAPMLMRRTIKPVTLGGITLGEGANIVIPIYVVHRHRFLWDEPLRFDPLRFVDGAAPRHRCAYMPFGAGPRTCVGASFAMIEGKAILATLLRQARFELPDGCAPTPVARVTLRAKEGLCLTVTPL